MMAEFVGSYFLDKEPDIRLAASNNLSKKIRFEMKRILSEEEMKTIWTFS